MPTELLTLGPVLVMTQNVIYATPVRAWGGFTDTTGATLEVSDTVDFAQAIAIAIDAEGLFSTPAPFIRCTSGNINVRLQAL